MIKAVTTVNKADYQRNERKLGAKVEISGNSLEIMHELLGILDALEEQCSEILIKALQIQMEDKRHDN